jgi:secreted trypsin-like serine protease
MRIETYGLGWTRVAVVCIAVTSVALWTRPALAIGNGHLADTCQYPSVVRLVGSRGIPEGCSGAYIGGRVILTAAHCFDSGGD